MHLLYKRYFEAFFLILKELGNFIECCCLNCLAKSSGQHWVHGEHVLYLSPKYVLGLYSMPGIVPSVSAKFPFNPFRDGMRKGVLLPPCHINCKHKSLRGDTCPRTRLVSVKTRTQTQTVWSMFSAMKLYHPNWTKSLQLTSDHSDLWILVDNFGVSETPQAPVN